MVDQQDDNKQNFSSTFTSDEARAKRLSEEILATTGVSLTKSEEAKAADMLAKTKPKSYVHSMSADISRTMQTVQDSAQEIHPQRSLADAVADLNTGKDDIAATVHIEAAPLEHKPSLQEQYIGYREKVVEGTGLSVETTPIPGKTTSDATHEAPKGSIMHSLKYDVQDLVKDRKVSLIRAVALESDKNATAETINKRGAITAAHNTSNAGIYLVSFLFFALGAIALGAVFYAQSIKEAERQVGVEQVKKNNALIFYEHEQKFDVHDLESYELLGGLARIRETVPATIGSITNILLITRDFSAESQGFVSRLATLEDFFKIAKPRLPKELTRNMSSGYMVGVHTTDENAPFILLLGTSYEGALAGMLAWEGALPQDLSPFFPSRGGTAAQSEVPQFSDISLDNIDARVLRTQNKKVRIVYAVLEQNVIVITNNIFTIKEIALRLHARTSNAVGSQM